MKIIKNVKIITKEEVLKNKAVLYNDRIVDIINENSLPNNCEVIDGNGCYLAPGFIDVHIHGCMGYDTMDENENAIYEMSKHLPKTGVTAFLPTTMTMPFDRIISSLEKIKKAMRASEASQVLGCHLEGPFLNKIYKGAQNDTYMLTPNFSKIAPYIDVIKIATIAPELEGSMDFIKECIKNNIVVSLGHSNGSYEEASAAIVEGASHITHTFNGMTPLHHRNPGIVGAAFNHSITCELITDNIHLHPAIQNIMLKIKGADKLILITDAMRACLMGDGRYDLGGQTVIVKGKEARLESGSIAGSVHTMNMAIKNFLENTDADIVQAVKMATLNPAKLIGCDTSKGSIEINKDADFVIFDEAFNVKSTIIGGRKVYQA